MLEYLENADCLNIWNFSNERLSKATESLAWVHKALVIHNDINFENVLVVPGNSGAPERVLVVDFDVSITYPTKDLFDEATSIHSTGPIKACDDDNHWLESYGKVLVCRDLPHLRTVSNI